MDIIVPKRLATVAVYDPDQSWGPLSSRVLLPLGVQTCIEREGRSANIVRVVHNECPFANVVLAVVPDRGFDRQAATALQGPAVPWIRRLYLAIIDDEMLTSVSRSTYGFRSLTDEVKREFNARLVLVRMDTPDDELDDALSLVLRIADCSAKREQAYRKAAALSVIAVGELGRTIKAGTLLELENSMNIVCRAECIQDSLRAALRAVREVEEEEAKLNRQWEILAKRSLERCLAAARGGTVHGMGAEDIITGIADHLEEVEKQVVTDFSNPPVEFLKAWAKRVSEVVAKPELVLPVVGVFSTGKTSLINHILGPSPDGHALLRTSRNHNTALLSRFHYSDRGYLQLQWKKSIDYELVWHGDRAKRVVRCPVDGTIESIQRVGDGLLLIIRAETGEMRWTQLDKEHIKLNSVREGARVKANEALSEGIDENTMHLGLLAKRPSTPIYCNPWAIRSMLRFLDDGRFADVRLEVRWRQREKGKLSKKEFKLKDEILNQGSDGYLLAVQWLRDITRGREGIQPVPITIPPDASPYPVRVRMSVRLAEDKCEPCRRPLDSEQDWTWFQGPPDQRACSSEEGTVGFAESAEAAWLVEQADLYLNAPLFRIVSLMDTPGLDSISEHHDRTTEGCIHRGQVFLVMARLGRDTFKESTERTFHMIVQSLVAQKIPRSDWRERVFIVLNWFDREVGAWSEEQARTSANRFKERMRAILDAESPRMYIVNMTPTKLDENPDKLLGYNSLAVLKRDLRSFIGLHGVAIRLVGLQKELQESLVRIGADLTAEASSLGVGNDNYIKNLELVLQKIGQNEFVWNRIREQIREAVDEMIRPITTLRSELERGYRGKDDFEQAKYVGLTCMAAYNQARNAMKISLEDELNMTIKSAVSSCLQNIPRLRIAFDMVDELPVMTPDSYSYTVDRIINEWPGLLSHILHRMRNWFESYPITKRNELRSKYVSKDLLKDIKNRTEVMSREILRSAGKALDAVTKQLARQLDDVQADANRQATRRVEIEALKQRLTNFQPAVVRTTATISRVVAYIEQMSQRSGGLQ